MLHILSYSYLTVNNLNNAVKLGFVPLTAQTFLHIFEMINNSRLDFAATSFLNQFLFWLCYGKTWPDYLSSSLAALAISRLILYMLGYAQGVLNCILWHENLYLLFVLSLSTTLFAFWERVLKELWVIGETNRKSYNILRDMIEAQTCPSFVLDKQGKILYANKMASKIISKKQDKPTHSIYDLIHQSSREAMDSLLDPNYKNDKNENSQYIAILQNIKEADVKEK